MELCLLKPHSNAIFPGIKIFFICIGLALSGCTVHFPPPPHDHAPMLEKNLYIAADGTKLPLRRFETESPRAIVLAVHGFNDYSRSFEGVGGFLRDHQITVLAYDQRGFGGNDKPGHWRGGAAMADDLRRLAMLAEKQYPNVPVYLLGDSMGGAVSLIASTTEPLPNIKGVILIAPAVWGRNAMNPLQVMALWFTAHAMPWLQLSGSMLNIKPSNNLEMLRELSKDPLVLKEARPDTLYGMTDLMDDALEASAQIKLPTLILYGGKDEIIPKPAMRAMLERMGGNAQAPWQFVWYENGYHMLLRDLEAKDTWADIVRWIEDKPFDSQRGKLFTPANWRQIPVF